MVADKLQRTDHKKFDPYLYDGILKIKRKYIVKSFGKNKSLQGITLSNFKCYDHAHWRLHNEELNDLYCLPNIVRVIKWRRMRWAGHVAAYG